MGKIKEKVRSRNKIILLVVIGIIFICSVSMVSAGVIIIDHNSVDEIDNIPDFWINEVKKMLLNIPGESHGMAYREGLRVLSQMPGYEEFSVIISESEIPPVDSNNLRITNVYRNEANTGWVTGAHTAGEEDFWTSTRATDMMKNNLDYTRNTLSNPIHAFGFGWCYDMTNTAGPGGDTDPVYSVRWAGRSFLLDGSNQGRWGIDDGDNIIADNYINLQTYLDAIDDYNSYDNYTLTFFTTGPVETSTNLGENGYQRYLKHEAIRDYVRASYDGVLFDYADILTHDSNGTQTIVSWTDRSGVLQEYPFISDESMSGGIYAHIGVNGTVKLAKAVWVMMARISGWDGTLTCQDNLSCNNFQSWDVDESGNIDISDLVRVGQSFGRNDCGTINNWCNRTDVTREVDGTGVVDIRDLVSVAVHFS